jgi:hypothetical protein
VSSARRLLVPDTNTNRPATFTCGYLPRGRAFPTTTLASVTPAILHPARQTRQRIR